MWVHRLDLNRGPVMLALQLDLNRGQVMWVPRLDLNQGLVVLPLPRERSRALAGRPGLLKNRVNPPREITDLDKAVPERKDINPDNS